MSLFLHRRSGIEKAFLYLLILLHKLSLRILARCGLTLCIQILAGVVTKLVSTLHLGRQDPVLLLLRLLSSHELLHIQAVQALSQATLEFSPKTTGQ